MVFDRLFIRHWDAWNDGRLNRVFVAPLRHGNGAKITQATLVGGDVIGDVPSQPVRRRSEYAWSPDGKSLVLSARARPTATNRGRPTSTCIWSMPTARRAAKNLTAANKAWDTGPVFSADGKTLYYRAMKRPGFEADRFALMAMDLGSRHDARDRAEVGCAPPTASLLSDDGKTIYTTAQELGQHPLFAVDDRQRRSHRRSSATAR